VAAPAAAGAIGVLVSGGLDPVRLA
jgi:hypothetical protein